MSRPSTTLTPSVRTAGVPSARPARAPRRPKHLPQLDGLRTLAVVLVLAYHVVRTEEIPVLSGAFIGVDVFFVLSGFLITTLLLREHASNGRIDLRRFYVRRLWRLYPALVLVSLLVAFVFVVVPGPFGLEAASPLEAVVAMVYGMSWWSGLELTGGPYLLGLTWSLSVEEHFYLLWPLLLIVLLRRSGGVFGSVRAITVVALLANAWTAALSLTGADADRLYYLPDARFSQLLTGCALAALLERSATGGRLRPLFSLPAVVVAVGGMAAVVVTADRYDAWYWDGGMQAVGLASAVVIGHLVLHGEARTARALAWKPLATVGLWTYGIYLWHLPLIRLARPVLGETLLVTVVAALAAVPIAALSYRYVEQPLLRRRTLRLVPVPAAARAAVVRTSEALGRRAA